MFSVQWKSHEFYPDGTPRSRPPVSSVHGWLKKWQGTFSGNEDLRTRGMREMREAAARRQHEHNSAGRKISKSTSPSPKDRSLTRRPMSPERSDTRSRSAPPKSKPTPKADGASSGTRSSRPVLAKPAPTRKGSTATTTRSSSTKSASARTTTSGTKTATVSRSSSTRPAQGRRATEPPPKRV